MKIRIITPLHEIEARRHYPIDPQQSMSAYAWRRRIVESFLDMNRSLSDKPGWRRQTKRQFWDALQTARRQARRLVTNPRGVFDYARYRAALRRHDWSGLRSMLRPLSQSAMRAGDSRMLMELGHAALRLGEHQLGVELF